MVFNFFQLFILFGLLLGIICIFILEGSSAVKRKSNTYLTFLILCFIANLAQYWLRDVDLISNETMQLLFIPWQILIAPVFLLYVHSLKIFDHFPFKKKLLFAPFFIALCLHIIVKYLLLTRTDTIWQKPEWVSIFYLAEELISLAYSLVASIVVFLWIRKERIASNHAGYGVNKEIVKWIMTMMKMGLALAIVWLASLYLVTISAYDFRGYYLLWSFMAIVLNILGFVGIYYSLKEGQFTEINLTDPDDLEVARKESKSKIKLSAPAKYLPDEKVNILFRLTSQLSKDVSVNKLREDLVAWFNEEFQISDVGFQDDLQKRNKEKVNAGKLCIPFASQNKSNALLIAPTKDFEEAELYYFNLAAKAYGYHEQRIKARAKNAKIDATNKVFLSMLDILQNDELYTRPELDLSILSEKLNVSTGYLSKVINEASSKSFNELINDYRVKKVKLIMQDSSFNDYTIVSYGLEAGFNSKSTFYKAFQKREGMSPGKYLEMIKK